MEDTKVKIAVNGGISVGGSRLTAQQLVTIAKYLGDNDTLELTTFQQLYIEVNIEERDSVMKELEAVGLSCYPVGNYVKSLRTCNFCKGAEEEGLSVAQEINRRIAGKEVPFTLKAAYTGCPVGCGEPLMNDIGIMKKRDGYSIFVGGKSKGEDAGPGTLLLSDLSPDTLYKAIDKTISIYNEHAKKREAFAKFIKRVGIDFMKSQLEYK